MRLKGDCLRLAKGILQLNKLGFSPSQNEVDCFHSPDFVLISIKYLVIVSPFPEGAVHVIAA